MDVLSVMGSAQVVLETTVPTGPGVIRPMGSDDFVHVITMSYHDQIQPLSVDQSYYGVYLGTDHAKPLDYLAGMAVEDVDAVPECLVVRELPAAQYAVFECMLKTLGPTYGTIWKEWLPSSPYELDVAAFGFDFYPPNTTSGDSPMHIYFPIKARQKGKEGQ